MNYFFNCQKFFATQLKLLLLTGFFFFSTNLFSQYSQETLDSLETLINKQSLNDNELYLTYKKLTNAYLSINIEKSLEFARKGLHFARGKNHPYLIAEFLYSAGNSYHFLNQLDSALYYFNKSLNMQEQAKKKSFENEEDLEFLKLRLLSSIGNIKSTTGNYDFALNNYLKAKDIAEKINESEEILNLNNSIANTYFKLANYEQAEVYYSKVEKLSRELNDSTGLADAYLGQGKIFFLNKNYKKSLEYVEESFRLLSFLRDVPSYKLMVVNQTLTEIWLAFPDYNKALEYAKKSVKFAEQTGMKSYLASAKYTLATCYLKQEKYRQSEETAFQALETDSTDIYLNSVLYGNIALSNLWQGNKAKSVEYFGKTLNAIRTYSNKNFQSSLSEMEVKHETEKKELKIIALEGEKRLMKWLGIAIGAILFLALAAFLFLWRLSVQKRRVAEKQKQLAEQQVKQLEQEKQLVATQAVLDGETRERARLARDLHDGLGSMLTGVKLNLLEMKKGVMLKFEDVERFDKALGLLDNSVYEMRRVAHHLMPDSLSRFGLRPAVSDFCSNLPSVCFSYYGDESRLDPKLEVMIYRCIHELVNNALKHAKAEKIIVQIMQESNRIAFTVQDDGCGFDHSTVVQGMGLQNIRTRIASYNGVMDIDSRVGQGTEINVELRIES